jgi:cell shape-determining protein MreC
MNNFKENMKEVLKEYRQWIRELEKVYHKKYELALKNATIINWQIHVSVFENNLKVMKDMLDVIESESSSDIETLTIIIGNCIYAISKILFEIDKEVNKNE